ncbi:galactosyl transferase GMA12/MNN10 family-domain-containing protein [Pyronema domesticum]|uniref:Similar to Uncharacterized alpha-1,2-galactosyltransferase C1289.13c acc. no. O94622 n=1 Tax=Pyronema omphalodes (strain CBS 100304) TaxID=1076935 RepID=U4LPA1_PYROM|nr:galactosyl transferase GMA12/MNN10 family-domain-containing protein [Pyronema domesticum]CCX33397.1 Similar to Uncharacterized alpha-1,2-galactosyltransferase C1289.13c; acc. no. O94622 [Pyronema omphalodes CBS 100304]
MGEFNYSSLGHVRQRISPITLIVIPAITLVSVVLFVLSLYHPALSPTLEAAKKSPPGGPMEPMNSVLMLLPKDQKGDGDYGFHKDWLEMAIRNRKEYADKHGYLFMWADLAEYQESFKADPMWAKIAALHDAFDKHPEVEWIWCLDSDVIIMNSELSLWDHLLSPDALRREVKPGAEIKFGGSKKLPQHKHIVKTAKTVIPEDVFIIISTDSNGLNAGSFFIRRNSFMSAFVDLWHDPYLMKPKFTFSEQDGLAHLIINHPHVLKHVGIVNQRLINSYPQMYRDHELLVHFAGCRGGGRDCDKMFKDFWNRRTIVPQNETETMED